MQTNLNPSIEKEIKEKRWTIAQTERDRGKYIGGTDAGAIMGYGVCGRTTMDVYKDKIGLPKKEISETKQMYTGRCLEPTLIEQWKIMMKYNDNPFSVLEQQYLVRHSDIDYIAGTMDSIVWNDKSIGFLEVKTAYFHHSQASYNMGNLTMPKSTFWQMIHYFVCSSLFSFAYLITGKVHKEMLIMEYARIDRSQVQSYITELENKEVKFWEEQVMQGISPNYILPDIMKI
jgi:predicted phage-related endonuclease